MDTDNAARESEEATREVLGDADLMDDLARADEEPDENATPLSAAFARVVAYCRKGANCGNPYMGGKFYYASGYYVDACPRCGGPTTHNPDNLRAR